MDDTDIGDASKQGFSSVSAQEKESRNSSVSSQEKESRNSSVSAQEKESENSSAYAQEKESGNSTFSAREKENGNLCVSAQEKETGNLSFFVQEKDGGNSFFSAHEKESGNKRKYATEFPINVPVEPFSLSLMELPKYEMLERNFQNTFNDFESIDTRSEQPKDEQEVDELEPAGWEDPVACQLQDVLLQYLYTTFMCAIKKIAQMGYSEEVAELSVLRSGLYYGSKDTLSNIVDGALIFLRKETDYDTSGHQVFEVLQKLVEYIMVEMICVLRLVGPSLTVADAMWRLLICDVNLSRACSMEGDASSGFHTKPNSMPSILNPQISCSENPAGGGGSQICEVAITKKESLHPVLESGGKSFASREELVQTVSDTTVIAEKSGSSRKWYPTNFKRDVLRQKTFHFEKCYKGRMSKGVFKTKVNTWGSMVMDKMKCPDSSGVISKSTNSNVSSTLAAKSAPVDGIHHLSNNIPSVLPAIGTSAALPTTGTVKALPATNANTASLPRGTESKTNTRTSNASFSPKVPNYYAGIPYDNTLKKYVPKNEKDEMIIALVPQLKALQQRIQFWTDWANNKVMEVARILSKDQAELKILKQEKGETDHFKKEKQVLEESTMKRLSEMEDALCNAAGQIEMANSAFYRLELVNSMLKDEMEAAKLQALKSSANLQEAILREQDAMKKAPWEIDKGLLQEELKTSKHLASDLKQKVAKANDIRNQMEARWKQEEREKMKLQEEVTSLSKKTEQLATLLKSKEDKLQQDAENDMHGNKEDITRIRREISELRLESESSRIAELRRGIDAGYSSCLTSSKSASNYEQYQTSEDSKRLSVNQDNFGSETVKPEHECVMCMTDATSVVFIPCAHQVLCVNCNLLHEKEGMNDCPSCRTPIESRVIVRFPSN